MKRTAIILLGMIPLFTFNACDERDNIQADVDAINARLDELDTKLAGMNESINSLYDVAMAEDRKYITDYAVDEKGNYTLTLSEGDPLIVYGGQPAEEIPAMGFRLDEATGKYYWTYTLEGVTYDLTVDGEPVQASPEDGRDGTVPQLSVKDGRWYYQVGGGEPQPIEGNYGIASVEDIPAGVFAEVSVSEGGKTLVFKFSDEGEGISIALLGGLNMTFASTDTPSTPVTGMTVAAGGTETLNATLTEVDEVIIDPTPLGVKLAEPEGPEATQTLTVTAPVGMKAGTYTVYFQIFSAKLKGYRMVIPLTVNVTEESN